jgi:branched-chain amino acid transport system substrate-binding protein
MAPRAVALAVAVLSLGCASPRGGSRGATPTSDRVDPVVLSPAEAPAEGSLRIAAIFPTIGRYAVSGMQSLNGARLAVDELNRAGGIDGRRLALREFRTGSYFVDAQEAAVRAARDGALALVGSNSSELSAAVAAEAEGRGVVQVSNVSTAQDLTWDPQTGRNRPFVFRVCSSDVVMGALLADFALEKLGAQRAAVLYEVGRAYSMKLARSFIDRYREASGRSPAEFFYLALETDFRPQLRRIADYQADVVFVPGSFSDASLIAAQATALGLRVTLLGGDAWSSPLLFRRGGPPGEAYFAELCSPAPDFDRRYEAVFGEETQGCRAILAHDAVEVVAAGLRALGPLDESALDARLAETRHRLRDAVAGVETVGASGPIRFDAHGDRRQGVALSAVEPGPDGRPVALARGWLGER